MYAIIKSGGKQYRVEKGAIIDVELLDAEKGATVEFDEILFIGTPSSAEVGGQGMANYFVKGEVMGEVAGPKVVSIKYKRSHNEVRKFGHRQHYSRVRITEIGKKKG